MADVKGLKLNQEKIATFSSSESKKCFLHIFTFDYMRQDYQNKKWTGTAHFYVNAYLNREEKFETITDFITYLSNIYGEGGVVLSNQIAATGNVAYTTSGSAYSYTLIPLTLLYRNKGILLTSQTLYFASYTNWSITNGSISLTSADEERPDTPNSSYSFHFLGDTVVEVPYPNMV